jgi:hypothetical protein
LVQKPGPGRAVLSDRPFQPLDDIPDHPDRAALPPAAPLPRRKPMIGWKPPRSEQYVVKDEYCNVTRKKYCNVVGKPHPHFLESREVIISVPNDAVRGLKLPW